MTGKRFGTHDYKVRPLLHAAPFLAILCFFPFRAVKAFPVALGGFVTTVSPAGFDIGATHVRLSPTSRCEIGEVRADPLFFYKHRTLAKPLYHPATTTAEPCGAMKVVIGSPIYLEGTWRSHERQFVASRVLLYSIKQIESVNGAALIEEDPSLQKYDGEWSGRIQIDGYPLNVNRQTRMIAAPIHTTPTRSLRRHILTVRANIDATRPTNPLKSLPTPNTWGLYHASTTQNDGITACQIRFWSSWTSDKEAEYLKEFASAIGENSGTEPPASIQLRNGHAVTVLSEKTIQDWLSRFGIGLVPSYYQSLPYTASTTLRFRFYVVHSFKASFKSGIVDINGILPESDGYDGFEYHNPPIFTQVKDVIALPTGIILVPDRVLASLNNDAELAALLSYAVTSIIQKQAFMTQHHGNGFYFVALWLSLNEQALRIGIRQMYLAGYDIREAPYAWAVAQGKPVNNPVIDSKHPDKEIPWYAAYAFNYISQYYQNVDYTKLKRGRREYQQFLQELRRADPEAFAPQKPQSAAKHKVPK